MSGEILRAAGPARLLDLGRGVLAWSLTAAAPLDLAALDLLEAAHAAVVEGRGRALVLGLAAGCPGLADPRDPTLAARLQGLTQRGLHAPYPVVAALGGRVLDAGLELGLGASARVLAADLACGLTQATAGLLPASGGCLRLLQLQGARRNARGAWRGPMQIAAPAFDLIASARVTAGAAEARRLRLVDPADEEVAAVEDLLARAADLARARVAEHRALPPVALPLSGASGRLVLASRTAALVRQGALAPAAARVREALAGIVTGGDEAHVDAPTLEERILELETGGLRAVLSEAVS